MKSQRGSTLLEGLIALTIFSFAVIGLAGFQATVLANDTQSQFRIESAYLAEEIAGLAVADGANATCYTVPATGVCANANGLTEAANWDARVRASLPGAGALTPTVVFDAATGSFTATLRWQRSSDPAPFQLVSITSIAGAL